MSERQTSLINTKGDHAVAEFMRAVNEDRGDFILNPAASIAFGGSEGDKHL